MTASLGANVRSSAREMIFACDVNLGFPTDDPEWAAFFRDHGWRTVNYDDMGMLIATLKAHQHWLPPGTARDMSSPVMFVLLLHPRATGSA